MTHHPILLKKLSLYFSDKICFTEFSAQIYYANRIAIIGDNGAGKSTLLKMLLGERAPDEGEIVLPADAVIASIPQQQEGQHQLSGGERFNKALTQALALQPNVLILDEPTNHLDRRNRQSLLRLLQNFAGTLIMASHDQELLASCADCIWHIDQAKVITFTGDYNAYLDKRAIEAAATQKQLASLKKKQKQLHAAQCFELQRAARSRRANLQENDRKLKGAMREKGSRSQGNNARKLQSVETEIGEELATLYIPKIIQPHFALDAAQLNNHTPVTIFVGSCGYTETVLKDISLSIGPRGRVAIMGDNGAGKSTLVKALLNDNEVFRSGDWSTPKREEIAYLDQHYRELAVDKTVYVTLEEVSTAWSMAQLKNHLADFLFQKPAQLSAQVATLSSGEKARLLLAKITARPPRLLILDEITNNLDLTTLAHVVQTLRDYPGALLVISHDLAFLRAIHIADFYTIDRASKSLQYTGENF